MSLFCVFYKSTYSIGFDFSSIIPPFFNFFLILRTNKFTLNNQAHL